MGVYNPTTYKPKSFESKRFELKSYEPKSCCFWLSTKHGSIILASLSLIMAILSMGFAVYVISLEAFSKPTDLDNIVVCVCIAVIVFFGADGVCSSLLIHGIRKNRPGLMLPYLLFQRFCIIIKIMTILVVTGLACYLLDPAVFVRVVLPLIIGSSIFTYFYLVVNSYHKQVKRSLSAYHGLLQEEFDIDQNGCKIKVMLEKEGSLILPGEEEVPLKGCFALKTEVLP